LAEFGAPALGVDRLLHLTCALFIRAIVDGNLCTVLSKEQGGRRANAARCAGDEYSLAGKVIHGQSIS
jgi:hypothetical protein